MTADSTASPKPSPSPSKGEAPKAADPAHGGVGAARIGTQAASLPSAPVGAVAGVRPAPGDGGPGDDFVSGCDWPRDDAEGMC